MLRPLVAALAAAALAPPLPATDEPVDLAMVSRIREEGLENSRVMDTIWHLTDLYGPRLTNSPQERAAAAWARDRLTGFGLESAALEPWGEFGLGWSYERCVIEMTAPTYMPIIGYPKAWTRGLEAPIEGAPMLVSVETEEDVEALRGTLAGKIVLNGSVEDAEPHFEATASRHDEDSLEELAMAPEPGGASPWADRVAEWRRRRAARRALRELLTEEGAAIVIEPDGGRRHDYGVVLLGSGGSPDPEEERALPQVTIATEHFNRLARLIERGHEVTVRADVRTTFHDEDLQGYNVVAEIPGTDPEIGDELVLIGGHFDSWHPGTGATDNGASCAVAMEAARILEAVGPPLRRTVRVVLWTGEEQGLLGSKAYVAKHFADRETMELLPGHDRFSAYFNMDNGAGRLRGVYLQGNAAVAPIFRAWMKPLADLSMTTLTMRDTGGTDHLSFDAVGLPGFQFIQDPMDYSTRTHHTNMDLYERVVPGDVMQASVVMATFAYHAAMRDDKLPRKRLPEPRPQPEEEPEEEDDAAEDEQQDAEPLAKDTEPAPRDDEAGAEGGVEVEAAEGSDSR